MRRFLFFVTLSTFAGLVYVYTEVEAVKIGYTIRKQEDLKAQSLDRARALEYNIASLEAPHNLERRLQAQSIQLESPKQWQTLMVSGGTNMKKSSFPQFSFPQPPFIGKIFVGTAQAEAKENSSR